MVSFQLAAQFFRNKLVIGAILTTATVVLGDSAFAFPIQMASSPESTLSLTVSAINSAQQSILINIYDLSSPEIVQAINNQVSRGLHVEILQEGQPVGGISAAARGLQASIIQAMSQFSGDRYVEMSSHSASGEKVQRRFRYDHAKYIVIDNSTLVVGSENYSPTGQPEAGSVGNRGWEVWVQDAELAQQFADMFVSDSGSQNADIRNLLTQGGSRTPNTASNWNPGANLNTRNTQIGQADASAITPLASPTTSQQGLLDLINSAQSSLMVEQMELAPEWKQAGGTSISSPLIDAMIAAAQRGVHVSVLVNDPRSFAHGGKVDPKNTDSVSKLNQAAASGLPIEARVANLKAMGVTYIHNKGALVDGQRTLISSINWDENSIESNRETALVVTSPDVYNFYLTTFQSDWNNSATPDTSGDYGNNGAGGGDAPTDGFYIKEFSSGFLTALTAMRPAVLSSTDGDVSPDECPTQVTVSLSIGEITLGQNTIDPSFQALQGMQSQGKFLSIGQGCSFRADTRTGPLFLQFRTRSSGWLVVIEGYTQTEKLYSIRGQLSESDLEMGQADLTASVYDSPTSSHKVGTAELAVSFK
jgi:phosphatidylserine/phosphatidylglycerophosphate/cardiolipin synthase-like enzyme